MGPFDEGWVALLTHGFRYRTDLPFVFRMRTIVKKKSCLLFSLSLEAGYVQRMGRVLGRKYSTPTQRFVEEEVLIGHSAIHKRVNGIYVVNWKLKIGQCGRRGCGTEKEGGGKGYN